MSDTETAPSPPESWTRAMTYPPRLRMVKFRASLQPVAFAGFALLAYFVLLGGTTAGELLTVLRAVNAVIGSVFIALWLSGLRRRHDHVDVAVLAAVVLIGASALLSTNARLSLDAAIQVMAFAATLWWLRGLASSEAVSAAIVQFLAVLCVIVVGCFAFIWGSIWIEWIRLTPTGSWPPLSLPLPTGLYLHRHDVALLVIMLAPAIPLSNGLLWRVPILRGLIGAAIGTVVLVDGSRNLVIAVVLALIALIALRPPSLGAKRARISGRVAAVVGCVIIILLSALALSGAVEAIADRLFNMGTLGARGQLWATSVETWTHHVLTGSGPGTFHLGLFEYGYFDTNEFFPRNPDGAVPMLLAETGLLGIAAGTVVVGTFLREVIRRRASSLVLFPIIVFLFAGIGSVPSDFAYLVVVALVWTTVAIPRTHGPPIPSAGSLGRSVRRYATGGLASVVAIACALMLAATIAYDTGRTALERGESAVALKYLRMAASLDPSFALYHRAVGVAEFAIGDTAAAREAMGIAIEIEPRDPGAHRAMAIVEIDRDSPAAAESSAQAALELHRTDLRNLLVVAAAATASEDTTAAHSTLVEILTREPWLIVAEEWEAMGVAPPDNTVLLEALDRWVSRPHGGESPIWLVAMTGELEHIPTAVAGWWMPATSQAIADVFGCRPRDAMTALNTATIPETAETAYWSMRILAEGLIGTDPSRSERMGYLAGRRVSRDPQISSPLVSRSIDRWLYRRQEIGASLRIPPYPSAEVSQATWTYDPVGAARSSGLTVPLVTCDQ